VEGVWDWLVLWRHTTKADTGVQRTGKKSR
jgi:hypothetical protein